MSKSPNDALKAILAKGYGPVPSEPLFHYTGLAAYLSILEHGKLWATEIRFLNDSREMKFFAEKLIHALNIMEPVDGEEIVRSQFEAWVRNRLLTAGHMIFVTSLSEVGNLLSQWRAYTHLSQGMSIGFSGGRLYHAAMKQSWRMGKCIYDQSEALKACNLICRIAVEHALKRGPSPPNEAHPSQSYDAAFFDLEDSILHVGALFKHWAFSEEREWRLVSPVIKDWFETTPIKYRAGNTSIVPYLEFDLMAGRPRTNGGGPITQVFVGPCVDSERSLNTAHQVLSRSQLSAGNSAVINSTIPYRGV